MLLRALMILPNGVEVMSASLPGLMQTSLNLGILYMREDGLHLTYLIRFSIASQMEMLVQRLRAIVETAHGEMAELSSYPGWQYARNSSLRGCLPESISGREGTVSATHGGLECGLVAAKIPNLDIISFGPELHDVHSPNERLSVPSTERTYALLCEILKRSK